jgi:CubicO group peptidase (beta-lactamase class C family)
MMRLWHTLTLLSLVAALTGCTAMVRNMPNIDDYEHFANHPVHHGPQRTQLHEVPSPMPPLRDWAMGPKYKEDDTYSSFFDRTGTVAFLVLRNDTLRYEWYAEDYNQQSTFTSFSLAKSYLSVLTGIAIAEGHIDSVRQPVGDFIPLFRDSALADITILHLLQMTSGLHSPEGFVPWSNAVKLYYGKDVMRIVDKMRPDAPPGTEWKYLNINSQLLGLVLEKATGKPLAQYLEEKIWVPMGMESDASWSLDHENGNTKAFCCLNAHARDYARFGLLLLNKGEWNGQQIVPASWLEESIRNDTSEASPQRYQYLWYTTAEGRDFYGEGLLGQFTYICPETHTVIVRLGHTIHRNTPWYDMFRVIAGIDFKPTPIEMPTEALERYAGTWQFGLSNFADSSLYGKTCQIKAAKNALDITTSFGQHFTVKPANDSLFFDSESARRLTFTLDAQRKPVRLFWSRRGNAWWLTRKEEEKP